MTKTQALWARARRLLSDKPFFVEERERVLDEYPQLNPYGLGQSRRVRQKRRPGFKLRDSVTEVYPPNLEKSRDELRTSDQRENEIRNTLEYLIEGRISLSYRLRGCNWARSFNGPAPARSSTYPLLYRVESYLRNLDRRQNQDKRGNTRYISNGAFICGLLMAGVRIWYFRDSLNPDIRLGAPWAVAGMQPEDFAHPRDESFARFWRWAVQQDRDEPYFEQFIRDTVDLLYAGASLARLRSEVRTGCVEMQDVYIKLLREFGLDPDLDPASSGNVRTKHGAGSLEGQYKIPDDFDTMGQEEIERMFYGD